MGASRIETEYNEINSKNGWMLAFQVIIHSGEKKNKKNRKKSKNAKLLYKFRRFETATNEFRLKSISTIFTTNKEHSSDSSFYVDSIIKDEKRNILWWLLNGIY